MEFRENGPTAFRNLFNYNNVMYLLAGCVAERLGGDQPLEQLMAERLFGPLGMNDTHFISELKDHMESDGRLATMYFWNSTAERFQSLSDRILGLDIRQVRVYAFIRLHDSRRVNVYKIKTIVYRNTASMMRLDHKAPSTPATMSKQHSTLLPQTATMSNNSRLL